MRTQSRHKLTIRRYISLNQPHISAFHSYLYIYNFWSRDNVVGIATRLNDPGFDPRQEQVVLPSSKVQSFSGPPILLFKWYRRSAPGVKWPGCGVHLSPPSSAWVANEWSYTSTHPTHLRGVHMDTFTLQPQRQEYVPHAAVL